MINILGTVFCACGLASLKILPMEQGTMYLFAVVTLAFLFGSGLTLMAKKWLPLK